MSRAPRSPVRRVRPKSGHLGCPVNRLKVGAFDYRIIFTDEVMHDGSEVYGLHDPERHEISLSTKLNARHLADIALHEVNHAVWHVGNMGDARGEESICARHASTMTAVESDNLPFFRWRLSLLEPCP